MCGITGAIWNDPRQAIDRASLQRMTDALRHRGPDDSGLYLADYRERSPYEPLPGVALGFRRLSIIDLETGAQPLSNEDGSVWLAFNGEIYNYQALRHRLEGAGHTFRTHGDSETIVHLYEDEGVDCFRHLNGMFAIALWDARLRRLVIARDRLGEKPLVYRQEANRLLFASELKSILELPDVPREVDPAAVDAYLTYQYVPHPQSILRGFRKLPPGHYAVWCDGKLEVQPYWTPDFQAEQSIDEQTAAQQLREKLGMAVKLRLRSDVPLGAFLSGGVDSSLVVALMQREVGERVKTFTIGFPIAEYDETRYARRVAEHLGTEHHEFRVEPSGVDILSKLVWHYDEPFADSSAIPTWYVSQLTREHVTVALTGDGGDELFAGYPRYKAVALGQAIDRIPWLRKFLGASFWQRVPGDGRQKSLGRRWKRFSAAAALPTRRRYLDWISIFNESRRADLYREEFVEQLDGDDPFLFLDASWSRMKGRDAVTAASLTDLLTYLPCDLMTKVDIASMGQGLECRQPFLDPQVVEFSASLPARLKFRRGKGKRLLRAAFGDLLPAEIWTRPKMGFGVPLDHWFRGELRELTHDTLLNPAARTHVWFRVEAIRRLIEQHESGEFDHAYRLWSLVFLELWLKQWVSTGPTRAVC
jgi:asparagine synthase (glutamine-hydrolysing)